MQILILGNELIAPQLALALRDLGHHIQVYNGGELQPPLPQLLLSVNERQIAEHLRDTYDLPLGIWFSDTHRLIFQEPRAFALNTAAYKRTFFFCFSAAQRDWFHLAGAANAMLLPLAADPLLFCPQRTEPPELGAAVSFMGELRYSIGINQMNQLLQPLRQRAADPNSSLGQQAQQFLQFLQQVFRCWGRDLTQFGPVYHLQWLQQNCPPALRHLLNLYSPGQWCEAIDHQLNAEQRIAVCRSLADLPLSIWGDQHDWLAAGNWPGHHGRRADYWQEWPAIAAQSHACLNLIRPSCWHGVPLKAFEIAAAGSLLLTNTHPSLEAVFEPQRECLVFASIAEARQLGKAISKNPQQFADIAAAGLARVRAEHSYEARARTILAAMASI